MGSCRIVIVGGGFAGASAAVQLARKIAQPLDLVVVDPSADLGAGLAYSTQDPAFRLNAITGPHSIDVADPAHFTDWCRAQGMAAEDPDARLDNGELFVRRRDFRRYLAETVRAHAAMPNGTTIRHLRARATALRQDDGGVLVELDDGTVEPADMVVLAVGNPPLRQPGWATGPLAGHPGVVLDPLRGGLGAIPAPADVLVIGAGLTALDIVASLLGRGHMGRITVVSRRGLRPHAQAPRILAPPAEPPEPPVVPLDLIEAELPPYVRGETLTALALLQAMRRHAAQTEAEGLGWQAAFDQVSMPLSRIWPKLPTAEKQRALRHLRHFYDAHRFRTPPMTDALVRTAESAGQVAFRKAAVAGVAEGASDRLIARLALANGDAAELVCGAVVNCTGFDSGGIIEANPLLACLKAQGRIMPHPTGLGIETDVQARPLAADGAAQGSLRAIGPLTAGVFGDPLGVFFISAQIHRLIPGIAEQLGLTLRPH